MNKAVLIALVFLPALLVGCGETTKSVDYYTEHKDERNAKLQECRSNPGELQRSPNCVNTMRSQAQEDFNSKNKGMPKGW